MKKTLLVVFILLNQGLYSQNTIKPDYKKLEVLWSALTKSEQCLGGFQDFNDKNLKTNIPELLIANPNWKKLIAQDKTKVTFFLISKFSNKEKTTVHTCSFFRATNSELAVYLLQHIYKKNWYDFKEFNEYSNKEITSATDQPQMWLQNILNNSKSRKILKNLWLNELLGSTK